MTDIKCLGSSPESENGSILACGVDIIDEKLATLDAGNASSSQSPRDEKNVTEMLNTLSALRRRSTSLDILH